MTDEMNEKERTSGCVCVFVCGLAEFTNNKPIVHILQYGRVVK